jgi:hypothetical protein
MVPPQAFAIRVPVFSADLLLRRLIPGRPWRRLHWRRLHWRRLRWLILWIRRRRLVGRLLWRLIWLLLLRWIWLLLLVLLWIRRGHRIPADYQSDNKADDPQEEPKHRITGT